MRHDIEKVKEILSEMKLRFSEEELNNTDDDSVRWLFHDAYKHLDHLKSSHLDLLDNIRDVARRYEWKYEKE
tara:strand:+ start:366 stop:581 length:216 start_codon:yes stop_codon:yes gene_type:complete